VAEAAPVPELVEGPVAAPVVTIRYFAAAADAAGLLEETLPALETVGQLRAALIARYGAPMARVLASGSFLVDGVVSRDDSRTLGQRVDVLPPFAGG
jgi:molybdopterin converting factor small subunit